MRKANRKIQTQKRPRGHLFTLDFHNGLLLISFFLWVLDPYEYGQCHRRFDVQDPSIFDVSQGSV
jgi:hypothetical protein